MADDGSSVWVARTDGTRPLAFPGMRKPGEDISEAKVDSALTILGLKNEIVMCSFAHMGVSRRFQALQKLCWMRFSFMGFNVFFSILR